MASRRVKRFRAIVCLSVLAITTVAAADIAADFEDLALVTGTYWNGSDGSGGFTSGTAYLHNNYDNMYKSWDGFSCSNITNTTTSGMASQYNAIVGGGQGGSKNYAVGYVGWASPPTITLNTASSIKGLYVTNNNYAYYSMLNGDAFAKKFGGASGNDEDWFALTITGKNSSGNTTGTVNFFLADYRFADNGLDYIVDTWQYVDLMPVGIVKSLEFTVSSSDAGEWGMNTPAYFAIDTIVPEPCSIVLLGVGGLLLCSKKR